MIKTLQRIFRVLFKIILILIIGFVILDVITSVVRYKKYYSQTDITHPLLGTVHNDYTVNIENSSTHSMEEFKGKIKLIYWHSGCTSSTSWFPRIENIARQYPDSLEIFLITNQSTQNLDILENLDSDNFNICIGKGRTEEKRFKHASSSHLVILDKNNIPMAYGYQLNQTDSVIKFIALNQEVPKSLNDEILFGENKHQDNLKNINNLNFQATGYDPNFESRASSSINKIDFKNFSIENIYSIAFKIPNYRIINLTNGDLNGISNSDKYCVHYETKSPFAPMIWQMFFSNREKRANVFRDDLHTRIDKEFGLKSKMNKRRTTSLILKDIKPNDKNNFKKLIGKSAYKHDISVDSDSTMVIYSYKTNLDLILTEIERGIEMPIISDNIKTGKYQLDFSILDKNKIHY